MTAILLTPAAVADRLNLSTSTLAKWRVYGRGPSFIRLESAVRYPEDALADWIASQPRRASTSDGQLPEPADPLG